MVVLHLLIGGRRRVERVDHGVCRESTQHGLDAIHAGIMRRKRFRVCLGLFDLVLGLDLGAVPAVECLLLGLGRVALVLCLVRVGIVQVVEGLVLQPIFVFLAPVVGGEGILLDRGNLIHHPFDVYELLGVLIDDILVVFRGDYVLFRILPLGIQVADIFLNDRIDLSGLIYLGDLALACLLVLVEFLFVA